MNRRTFFGMLVAATAAVTGFVTFKKTKILLPPTQSYAPRKILQNIGLANRNGDLVRDFRDGSYWIVIDAPNDVVQWAYVQPPDHW